MFDINSLLSVLGYDQSTHYYPVDASKGVPSPEMVPLFRASQRAKVHGIYVFRSGPETSAPLPEQSPRIAVYVATAQNTDQAREIHRRVWNLSHAPFLIVLLPDQIRIYTGFDYSAQSNAGLLEEIDLVVDDLHGRLQDFFATSIDVGNIWQSRYRNLRPERRVDIRLLDSLKTLGASLQARKVSTETAHALIGKYVYIRYLYDRGIISDFWLRENRIDIEQVLGREANRRGLSKLVKALDNRFNGNVFPLAFSGPNAPTDDQIALVASAFKGDQIFGQMHFDFGDFQAYQFQYIPVEVLSSIYEQFLHVQGRGQKVGAIYTPEVLADYMLSEMAHVKPLQRKMKVLDPACGSGIFLVLAYRRLVEQELAEHPGKKLRPRDYRQILLDSIYGVERELDACYVAEFSLILTLLDYLEPRELHRNKRFKFPALHGTRIFQCDFFDNESVFWSNKLKFDWIVGNPPWIKVTPDDDDEKLVYQWIKANQLRFPVGDYRVSEAFSWRVLDLAQPDGIIGLVLHATSLVNHKSAEYRRSFFEHNHVQRITNFANLRHVLFNGRSDAPAVTVIYSPASEDTMKADVVHYGPFFVNQIPTRPLQGRSKQLWTITINASEIRTIPFAEAERGDSLTWKLALWGTHRDGRAIQRIERSFPLTLEQLCEKRRSSGWSLRQGGPELREQTSDSDFEPMSTLAGKKILDVKIVSKSGRRFSIPDKALITITENKAYIRARGGKAGLDVAPAPHIAISAAWIFVFFSDKDFLIPARQFGLAAKPDDSDHLRALTVFLSSSLVQYYMFFKTQAWGVERDRITLDDLKNLPVPYMTAEQIAQLAKLHRELAQQDSQSTKADNLQLTLDRHVAKVLNIPRELTILSDAFVQHVLPLNDGRTDFETVNNEVLRAYAETLATELDSFAQTNGIRHHITINTSKSFIVCTIELIRAHEPIPVTIEVDDNNLGRRKTSAKLDDLLAAQTSQWVYVRRDLRVFTGSKVHIFKMPRLIDWTKARALEDADDVIDEVLFS